MPEPTVSPEFIEMIAAQQRAQVALDELVKAIAEFTDTGKET